MLIILRALADILWEYKVLSVVVALVAIAQLLSVFMTSRNQRNFSIPEILVTAFVVSATFSLVFDASVDALIVYGKVAISALLFFVGTRARSNFWEMRATYVGFSVFLVVSLSAVAAMGRGFQYWGDFFTFSGPYFYKTDLAIAVTLNLAFILASALPSSCKLMVFFMTTYLVFVANSRLFLPIILALSILYLMRQRLLGGGHLLAGILVFVLSSWLIVFVASTLFESSGLLSIKLGSDLLTEENTQGRSVIWEILWDHYLSSSVWNQIFGLGFAADRVVLASSGLNEANFNAHSTYLLILFAQGIFGFSVFLSILIETVRRLLSSPSISMGLDDRFLAASVVLIFVVAGLTQSVIAYQQISWIFFLYAGWICRPAGLRFKRARLRWS